MNTKLSLKSARRQRRGSTLVIVIALLGLLAFTGVMFFTFAAQEKAASQYFAEAAKAETAELDDVFDWGLRHILVGANDDERNSVSYSPTRRHSIIRNAFGSDISPHNGGVGVVADYNGGTVPVQVFPALGGNVVENLIDMVDSPTAWGLQADQDDANTELSDLFTLRGSQQGAVPSPDVDYTYPDINNMFLAYRGYAIRDNTELADRDGDGMLNTDADGDGVLDISGTPRYEKIPVTIPSFFRPALMKSAGGANAPGGVFVPMDRDWATDSAANTEFAKRSFRPHPSHLVRDFATGNVLARYATTAAEASAAGIASGPFPFLPPNSGDPNDDASVRGELGIWTGSYPTNIELDVDNDLFVESDGTTTDEGIWMDLHFPLQEHVDSSGTTRFYVVLHSFTIYDLDSLINLNIHGNLNNLTRTGTIPAIVGANALRDNMLSASHLGSGPHEISPLYALRRPFDGTVSTDISDQFDQHYGRNASALTVVEQANMEWFWILTGRAKFSGSDIDDIFAGRWGDVQQLYRALTDLAGDVAAYPRPGRSDGFSESVASGDGVRFGGDLTSAGTSGFDDNADRYEGEPLQQRNQLRAFGKPTDLNGTGRTTQNQVTGFTAAGRANVSGAAGTALLRLVNTNDTPFAWPILNGYNIVRDILTAPPAVATSSPFFYVQRYIFGGNQTLDGFAGDDLIQSPRFDLQLDDPLESVFDADLARRPQDNVFGAQDTFEMHMTAGDIGSSSETPTQRLSNLAPWSLNTASRNREMITTYSNTLRYVPFAHPFGGDGRPGQRGVDDGGNGVVDDIEDLTGTFNDTDIAWRAWEWSADTDGADRNNDGFPDGDGNLEFPPQFGSALPYSIEDPFRPQLRTLIRVEAGDTSSLVGQLPMSWNHIVDVDRRWDNNSGSSSAPREGTPEFLYYMQRSGLRMRELTPHPDLSENGASLLSDVISLDLNASDPDDEDTDGDDVFYSANAVRFPPETIKEREFWARRDRQQMARDIFVLLYTLGGGQLDGSGNPIDYTQANDPNLPEGQSLYTHEQLRRMAQFAVNVVDSLDKDNVVTKFEYDKNLGDGWNLDDDPYTNDGFLPFGSPDLTNAEAAAFYNNVTGRGLSPEDSGTVDTTVIPATLSGWERGVVYGVEDQQLALNEVFSVRTRALAADHPATMHADDIGIQDFLHVELLNVTPMSVSLGAESDTSAKAIWRLARFDREDNTHPIKAPSDFDKAIVILRNALAGSELLPGANLTIASASPGLAGPGGGAPPQFSDFYVDYDNTSGYTANETWERISPDMDGSSNVATGLTPGCDVDVQFEDHLITQEVARVLDDDSAPFTGGTETTTRGAFLDTVANYGGNELFNELNEPGRFTSGGQGFDLVLQRRVNPNLPNLSELANPWIEVDRIKVTFDEFDITDSTSMPSEVQNALNNVRSDERRQPFDTADAENNETAQANHRYNTITQENSQAVQWTHWHNHLNRDFASIAEVFALPVNPPATLARGIQRMTFSPLDQTHNAGRGSYIAPGGAGTPTPTSRDLIAGADGFFLQPDFPDGDETDAAVNASRDNRWFRILPFIEVPSRVHRMLGNYLNQVRLPGKININMIRHPEVYAGLIDDPFLMDLAPTLADTTPYYTGATDPGNDFPDGPQTTEGGTFGRDRWREFLEKRDRTTITYDPGTADSAPGGTVVRVPGLPSNGGTGINGPFRSLTNDNTFNGLDDTILGRLSSDKNAASAPNRTWLEVGTAAQHSGGGDGVNATQLERQQLLSKIYSNTTTVSNCFIVFGTAGLFEAAEDPTTGLVQVGGEFDLDEDGDVENDRKRAIFIIDRTEALNAFDAGSGDFDWNRLIKARIDVQ